MPSAVLSSRLISASQGKVTFPRSSRDWRQARWTYSLSIERPSNSASRSSSSPAMALKPTISVGQTKVKSFGQAKTTRHLPAWLRLSMVVKALAGSVPLTAVRENSGNLSPTVSMMPNLHNDVSCHEDGSYLVIVLIDY